MSVTVWWWDDLPEARNRLVIERRPYRLDLPANELDALICLLLKARLERWQCNDAVTSSAPAGSGVE